MRLPPRRCLLLVLGLLAPAAAIAGADGDGWSEADGDCDDADPSVHPGAAEGCDGIDTDCDGQLGPLERDLDGDGHSLCSGLDCDDLRPTVHALVEGEACDGLDSDCDGAVPPEEADEDADGWRRCAGDCDDTDPGRHPGASEACNGLDDDCDGRITPVELDADSDGLRPCEADCDDRRGSVFPAASELPDGLDNDCDGLVDERLGDDDDSAPVTRPGCTWRGCGWSFHPAGGLVFALWPFRRRRGRPRPTA